MKHDIDWDSKPYFSSLKEFIEARSKYLAGVSEQRSYFQLILSRG